jgi:archaetidylinositol phosphate synthase
VSRAADRSRISRQEGLEMSTMGFASATRIATNPLAGLERRCLIWMAGRLPRWITSDGLTALALASMAFTGLCYAHAPGRPGLLLLAIVGLVLNWFGDSLDGTLARVRHHERPRYGFYVDHVLDAAGILFLIAGLVAGGFVHLAPAAAFLLAYYLLTIEIALATHALGTFRISYWKFGPTELRILLAIGTLQLLNSPWSTIGGYRLLLFDIGTSIGAAGLLLTFIISAVNNTRKLYAMEPLPDKTATTGSTGPVHQISSAVDPPNTSVHRFTGSPVHPLI